MKALAFDIGGTKIYTSIIDENGQINQKIIQEIDLPAWVYNKGA